MKKTLCFFTALQLCFLRTDASATSDPTAFYTLQDAYQSALQASEAISIQESRVEQNREHVTQARGSLFPTLALLGAYTRQDNSALASGSSSAFTNPDQYTVRLNSTQGIFHGLKEFAALGVASSQVKSFELTRDQAKISLYLASAQAYYNLLANQQDLANLRSLSELTEKRIADLTRRNKIGQSRNGEVLAVQAQLATLRGQLQAAEVAASNSQEQFFLVTRLPRTARLVDADPLPSKLPSLEEYLGKIEKRPDLQSQRALIESTEDSVKISRAGHLPTLDANANYYLLRTGVLQNSKWDFGLIFSLPLFQGGIVDSQVREAVYRVRENELLYSQMRRNAEYDIRTFYESMRRGLDQINSFKDALEMNQKNFKEQTKDYNYGLVTNIEVLQSMSAFQEAKRQYDRARYQTYLSFEQLEASIGEF